MHLEALHLADSQLSETLKPNYYYFLKHINHATVTKTEHLLGSKQIDTMSKKSLVWQHFVKKKRRYVDISRHVNFRVKHLVYALSVNISLLAP